MTVQLTEPSFYILPDWSYIMILSYPFCYYIVQCFSVECMQIDAEGAMTLWMHMCFYSCCSEVLFNHILSLELLLLFVFCLFICLFVLFLFICFFRSLNCCCLDIIHITLCWLLLCFFTLAIFIVNIFTVYFCFCYVYSLCSSVYLLVYLLYYVSIIFFVILYVDYSCVFPNHPYLIWIFWLLEFCFYHL
jgi:hypothetical protein